MMMTLAFMNGQPELPEQSSSREVATPGRGAVHESFLLMIIAGIKSTRVENIANGEASEITTENNLLSGA